ncbi:MAG TPA: hypothetical protein VFT09_00085 [Ilumatobacteraceae bacterium]|nr:hypothetical protein [Ilumatobacteraceae bacterium]
MISEPLDAAGVRAVVAIDDPILRNLWITQSYFDLGNRLQRAVGGADRTWCGFAVWASDTAGQSIRGEELPKVVQDILDASPEHRADVDAVNRRLRPLRAVRAADTLDGDDLVVAMREAVASVSGHIAHGNVLVYCELAPLFVAFVERCEAGDPATITAAELQALLATAAPGGHVEPDVAQAFEWWRRAIVTTDERSRAFAVLAANVLAVAHEQRRLQADIAAAMDTGMLTAGQVMDKVLPRWSPSLLDRLVALVAGQPLRRIVRRAFRQLTTELLMTLRVPGAVLHLHDDVPPMPDGSLWPAVLAELADSPEEVALAVAVYRTWDRTSGTGLHDGARDWAVLHQRMSYIVNLFRGRQRDPSLAAHPFTDEQLAVMRRGAVPSGPLLPPRGV